MKKFILGKKIGMTQIIEDSGEVVPVTVLEVEPCKVVDLRTSEKNGYEAVVVGSGTPKEGKVNKPLQGFFKSKKVDPAKVLKEFRVDSTEGFEVNQEISLTQFEKDEKVNVKSKSIGRGFAGTIKRHGFARGPMTHGSKNHRLPGSIGAGTDPARVFKGTRMGGHMGDEFVTTKNLVVVRVDANKGVILIKGSVPGKKNNLVEIYN